MTLKMSDNLMAVCRRSPEGKRWLDRLPEVVGRLMREWSLSFDSGLEGEDASCSFVAAVRSQHGAPAVLKNALDYAYPEWNRKPVAFVGYGAVGAARAIEQLRLISIELQMAPTRSAVHLAGGDFMAALREGKPISEFGYLKPAAEALLDELSWWAHALKTAREATAKGAAVAAQ